MNETGAASQFRAEPGPAGESSVCVLLSTYNGEAHLEAQLESLRAQEGVALRLHVRDDGSTDGTPAILRRNADHWPQLAEVEPGQNLGPAGSFLSLLCSAPDDAGFYAFCDQDDVWLPGKLARALNALRGDGGPALYCSDVICVAEDLSELGRPGLGDDARLQHLLFENIAFGCTIVMNRAARDLIIARPPQRAPIMHDWWCALVVAGLGRIHYDREPQVLYRQHGANVIGTDTDRLTQIVGQVRKFLRDPGRFYPIREQAEEFLRLYGGQLAPDARGRVERLVQSRRSLAARARYALSRDIVRRRPLDRVVVRGLVVAGWY